MGGFDYYCGLCGGPLSRPFWDPLSPEQVAAVIASEEKRKAREEKSGQTGEDYEEMEDSDEEWGEEEEEEQGEEGMADHEEMTDDDDVESPFYTNIEYDPRVLPTLEDERLEWLQQFRVVSEVPEEYGTDVPESWISGPATDVGLGAASVRFPEAEGPFAGIVKGMDMYSLRELPGALVVPFHDQCRDLLLALTGEEELDAEALYEAVCSLSGGYSSSYLEEMDYGEIRMEMKQYWVPTWGREWLVMPPLDIPDLKLYYNALPEIDTAAPTHRQQQNAELQPPKDDPFGCFAPEILEHIMGQLSVESIGSFRLASRAARNLHLSNWFWRDCVRRDMGFLFDMPASARDSRQVDWRLVYRDISRFSNPCGDEVIRGLANRARIWKQTLPQIAKPYMESLDAKRRERSRELPVFKAAKSEGLATLVLPEPTDAHTTNVGFMSRPHLLHRAKLELVIGFNEYDEIAHLDAVNHAETALAEETRTFTGRVGKVAVPDDRWLVGFIVTTSTRKAKHGGRTLRRAVGLEVLLTKGESIKVGNQHGDKKALHVPPGDFIVGLKVRQSTAESVLCRLGLFCHQSWRAGSSGERQHNYNDHEDCSAVQGFMWRRNLPPDHQGSGPPGPLGPLKPCEPCTGYAHDYVAGLSPLEPLIWNPSGNDYQHITSISADVLFGGFRVTYDNQPDHTIGPRPHAMKTLTIDGALGEQIVSVHCSTGCGLTSIRFVTSWNRQLIIGQPEDGEVEILAAASTEGCVRWLSGIYAYWHIDFPQSTLEVIGGFAFGGRPEASFDLPPASLQVGGQCFEPMEPPQELATSGPCIGARTLVGPRHTNDRSSIPCNCALKAWLDCSPAVASVRTTLCHMSKPHALPLVGLTLTMADGSTTSIGPNTFPSVPDGIDGTGGTDGGNRYHSCWCALGYKNEEEQKGRPHYVHDTWNVGGQRLAKLRIWLWPLSAPDEGHILAAISWVAADGSESPRYGHWGHTGEGEEVHEVEFGEGKAVGFVSFVGFNDTSVTRSNCTVQAIQALVEAGGG